MCPPAFAALSPRLVPLLLFTFPLPAGGVVGVARRQRLQHSAPWTLSCPCTPHALLPAICSGNGARRSPTHRLYTAAQGCQQWRCRRGTSSPLHGRAAAAFAQLHCKLSGGLRAGSLAQCRSLILTAVLHCTPSPAARQSLYQCPWNSGPRRPAVMTSRCLQQHRELRMRRWLPVCCCAVRTAAVQLMWQRRQPIAAATQRGLRSTFTALA